MRIRDMGVECSTTITITNNGDKLHKGVLVVCQNEMLKVMKTIYEVGMNEGVVEVIKEWFNE